MTNHNHKLTNYWTVALQQWIACICCIAMLIGMLFSRGILSVSMIVMVLNTLHPIIWKKTWQESRKERFLLYSLLFFISYLVAGLWSEDKAAWFTFIQIKLPFVFIPFALLNAPLHIFKFRKFVIQGILLVLLAGMLYSLSFLIRVPGIYTSGQHLPSPLEGDYIRFTIALVLGINLVFYLFYERLYKGRLEVVWLVAWCLVAVIYIHIQAAKSGLVSFYLLGAVYIAFEFIRKKRWKVIAAASVIGIVGVIGFLSLPSVKKQIANLSYEQRVWETNDTIGYKKSSSFVPRLISYQIAGELILGHPLTGVGPGDMVQEIDRKYNTTYPSIRGSSRILPHNQFMCTMLVVGIPMGLILLLMVAAPVRKKRIRVYTLATFLIMLFGLMIEPMLEVQYGVFTYLFFTLLWMAIFKSQNETSGDAPS